jgi:hypothetical protein
MLARNFLLQYYKCFLVILMHGENCLCNKLSDLCHNALSLHSGLSFLVESSDRLRSPEMEQTMEKGMHRKLQF